MEKLDLVKKYKTYYKAKTKPEIVEIEAAQYLSITGKGDPSGEGFARHIEAMYPLAYTLKFMFKTMDRDFAVPKLEGLWSFDEALYGHVTMAEAPTAIPRSEWEYRLLIRLPEYVEQQHIQQAIETVVFKKNLELAREIELYKMNEGKSVQMLHVGPFDREPETLQIMMAFMEAHGLSRNGLHHEIYLSDFRKTAPEQLKTILREPVR